MLPEDFQVIPVRTSDSELVLDFLSTAQYTHRHLDWRLPIDWLGEQPYLLCSYQEDPISMIVCPYQNGKEVWIRSYSGQAYHSCRMAWPLLLEKALDTLRGKNVQRLYSIALTDWYKELLTDSGFVLENRIVVLEKTNWQTKPLRVPPEGLTLKEMESSDLEEVWDLDQISFEPLWQLTLEDIEIAFRHSENCTVLRSPKNELVGYQIGNMLVGTGHLARIAIHPDYRRMHAAQMMLSDALKKFAQLGATKVTVNTQKDNLGSLQLYHQNGFLLTGDEYPVYSLTL
jgi:ribosomal protein S18 acetylase RimI-like enzyme